MISMRLFAAALLTAPIVACNCGEDPLSRTVPPDDDPPLRLDAGFSPDAEEPDLGPADSGEPEARVLTFDGTSPVSVYFGATRDLRFVLRKMSGDAIPNEAITFTLSGTAGSLSATNVLTDASGGAIVRFTAGLMVAQGSVTASAELAQPVVVVIDVVEDPAASLTLDVVSAARIAVSAAEANVYVGPAATVPTCAQLYSAAMLPAPTFTASFSALPGSSSFAQQPSGSVVTAFATGTNATGAIVARGCSEGTRLAGGVNTRVLVTLDQLAADYDGDYDALLHFDLGATLPPPLGPTIVLITDLLSDPSGWVVYQTLAALDGQLGTGFVQWTPPPLTSPRTATFDEVRNNQGQFPTWVAASNALDNFLIGQFGQAYIDITTVGGDLAHLVREFEVGAGYTITSTGSAGRVEVVEQWQALVFQWQLGCPAGDLGCARRPIQLNGANANLAPAQATYGATVVYSPRVAPPPAESERYTLTADPHQIVLRYGAVILLLLNELVFPNLPAGIAGNNLTAVLNNIVDCPDVAASLETATGLPAAFFEAICVTAVASAASAIEAQILALDSSNNPVLTTGNGSEMILVDHDHDLATELVESVTTHAQWSTGQNVVTPITGKGRRRASFCGVDADCATGLVCTPIPSYLEVKAVENDCRRPVGLAAGTAPCTQHADCASGVCFEATPANNICFAACTGAGSCAVGTCTQNAAPIDLDPVLMGLGDATISACVP